MTTTLHDLTPVEQTALLTAQARALDSRAARPILGDTLSDQIGHALQLDGTGQHVTTSVIFNVALRGKAIDRVVRRCLADNPHAVVLDLGAGLDTRFFRVDPPRTVDWYDIDYPAVIDIRREVVPGRPHAHTIGDSLTDPHVLDQIPTDRHAVIVAEATFPFMSQQEIESLLDRLIAHVPSGDLIFNGYSSHGSSIAKLFPRMRSVAQQVRGGTFDDPHEPERWNPRLRLVKEILIARDPESAEDLQRLPALYRVTARLFATSTRLARTGVRVLHYRF